ncbi:MAG: small, acid-soluble spore protein, alpha/beta type [Bacillota bacterium]
MDPHDIPQQTKKKRSVKKEDPLKKKLKEEVARELGLMDEVKKKGWGGLTSRQTGRIGGYISGKRKKNKNNKKSP